jgi:hypothetical protein
MASRPEVARIAACREVDRIPVRGEVAGIAGRRDLIRKRDQQGAARRWQPPEPHNRAHEHTAWLAYHRGAIAESW